MNSAVADVLYAFAFAIHSVEISCYTTLQLETWTGTPAYLHPLLIPRAALRQCEEADCPSDKNGHRQSRFLHRGADRVERSPGQCVNAASLTIFKKHLKTHLFDCC